MYYSAELEAEEKKYRTRMEELEVRFFRGRIGALQLDGLIFFVVTRRGPKELELFLCILFYNNSMIRGSIFLFNFNL